MTTGARSDSSRFPRSLVTRTLLPSRLRRDRAEADEHARLDGLELGVEQAGRP